MYSTLLILKSSKCNMFKYVYKIINNYIRCFFFMSSYYTAVLFVLKVSFWGGIDKELTF